MIAQPGVTYIFVWQMGHTCGVSRSQALCRWLCIEGCSNGVSVLLATPESCMLTERRVAYCQDLSFSSVVHYYWSNNQFYAAGWWIWVPVCCQLTLIHMSGLLWPNTQKSIFGIHTCAVLHPWVLFGDTMVLHFKLFLFVSLFLLYGHCLSIASISECSCIWTLYDKDRPVTIFWADTLPKGWQLAAKNTLIDMGW